MSINCPNCKSNLPEHDEIQYRFCPRCGAEIEEAETQVADGFQTIEPDFKKGAAAEHGDTKDPGSNPAPCDRPLDQTLEPKISSQGQKRPAIRPPAGPPPDSFYRSKKTNH